MSTPIQALAQKASQPPQDSTPQATPSAPQAAVPTNQDAGNISSVADESAASGEGTSLQKAYSLLNERIAKLFDQSGVKRNFSIPYVKDQSTADHVATLGQKLPEVGGVSQNFLTTFHHAGGKGWGSEDGATVAHPANSLRTTLVTKDNADAIAAIDAARSFLNKIASLIGDTKIIQTAKSQLALVSKAQGANMSLMDFGAALISLVSPPLQEVARKHSEVKHGGNFHAKLTPPRSHLRKQ